jgi:tungstate transport system ATP-binding protein
MSALLGLRRLRKLIGGRAMLDLGPLALEAGQGYVLTGDNGSGKTTLLRILAGLEGAEIDGLEFKGRGVSGYPDWLRRQIVCVHQDPYLFHTSIAANIAYGLKARGKGGAEREALVREAVEWAGVDRLAATPPGKLSGGERQRVALARAKVLGARVILLDEPTANLDSEARAQTIALIEKMCRDNVAVVVACHDRELIELPHVQRLHLERGRLDAVP